MSTEFSSKHLLPEPGELRELLIAELDYLHGLENTIARNKDAILSQVKFLRSQTPDNWELDITPNWTLPVGGTDIPESRQNVRDFTDFEGWIVVGGKISVINGRFKEYSLNATLLAQKGTEARGHGRNAELDAPCCWSFLEEDNDWRVAKRYHFDIDREGSDDDPKPITHFQSGGEFKNEHLPAYFDIEPHYCSTPLDKPRVPYPPMDPILILQMLVKQYNSLSHIVEQKWGQQVQSAEKELWKDYYLQLGQWIDSDRRPDFDDFIKNC